MENIPHISEEQWFLLLSATADPQKKRQLQPALLSHIASCPECRALYDKARVLQYTARGFYDSAEKPGRTFSESGAYRKVASDQENAVSERKKGRLCVCMEIRTNGAVFLPDTLEEEGIARKYSLNFENGDTVLCDEEDLLSLRFQNQHLLVAFNDDLDCQYQFSGENGSSVSGTLFSGMDELSLETLPGVFYILEIFFREKNA